MRLIFGGMALLLYLGMALEGGDSGTLAYEEVWLSETEEVSE